MTTGEKGLSMNANKSIAGNGLLVGLLVVAIVGAAVLGLVLYKRAVPMDALPETAAITTDEAAAPIEQEVATDEAGNAVPSTEETATTDTSTPTETTTATSGEKITIDAAKAFEPRTLGQPDAPIKIVEYASLTCSHCAHFHNDVLPELKSKYIDTGKVFFEFREFPLNDPALRASLAARCLPKDKYEGFTSLLFKTQEHWAGGLDYMSALKQNAKLAGMSEDTFQACQDDPVLKEKMAAAMQEAQDKWKISATPTFIINDGAEIISGAQAITEFERVFRKVTNDAVGGAAVAE